MRDLASQVIRSGDEERTRAAIELHESAAQTIASVSWQLSALARDVSDQELGHRLLLVKRLTEDVLEDVRHLADTMHPRVLSDLGLSAALTQLARKVQADSVVRVTAKVDRSLDKCIDPAVAAAFYRTAHQALSNAVEHGQPKSVRIWLFARGSTIRLEIIDDGVGFDVQTAEWDQRRGSGIFAMRDRLALVNAKLIVESIPGAGTRVCAYIENQTLEAERTAS
jgi:signal transduction histidine kinase